MMLQRFASCWSVRLPGCDTRAVWTVALFASVQVADAAMTMTGAARFGYGVEANPILQLGARSVGLAAVIIAAKVLAVAFAVILNLHARHVTLVLLTLVYVILAMLPWAWVLAF